MQRLVQAGLPMNAATKLFLTHLHSDHVVDVPDLILTPWSAQPERKVPLEVWGPDGTRDMMHHLQEAFAFDIRMRRDVDESFSPDGIRVVAHDIREGKVYDRNGVTVTAFLVTHGAVKPSFGYRVDHAWRSDAGEESGWFGCELEGVMRARSTGIRHLEETSPLGTDDGDLRHCEHAVE